VKSKENELSDRLFNFAVKAIKFLRKLPESTEFKVIRYQLSKSSTSSGANYEEAQAASSTADFIYKVEIAYREMRESNYWLRIIQATTNRRDEEFANELKTLLNESTELKLILASIIIKAKSNRKS
jgi:four helix bundle protein